MALLQQEGEFNLKSHYKYEPVYIGQPEPVMIEAYNLVAEQMGEAPPHPGKILRFRFANNYGASVISTPFSHGGVDQWELILIQFEPGDPTQDGKFEIKYLSPDFDDVYGYLNWDKVEALLAEIEKLPPAEPTPPKSNVINLR